MKQLLSEGRIFILISAAAACRSPGNRLRTDSTALQRTRIKSEKMLLLDEQKKVE
jgi:hypothetical protein